MESQGSEDFRGDQNKGFEQTFVGVEFKEVIIKFY